MTLNYPKNQYICIENKVFLRYAGLHWTNAALSKSLLDASIKIIPNKSQTDNKNELNLYRTTSTFIHNSGYIILNLIVKDENEIPLHPCNGRNCLNNLVILP